MRIEKLEDAMQLRQNSPLDRIPSTYKSLWRAMSDIQRKTACCSLFAGHDEYEQDRDLLSIVSELSKLRGWNGTSKFKLKLADLSHDVLARSCLEVADSQRFPEFFYVLSIRRWLLRCHSREIGLRFEEAGIPLGQISIDVPKPVPPAERLVSLILGYHQRPTNFGLIHLGHILITTPTAKTSLNLALRLRATHGNKNKLVVHVNCLAELRGGVWHIFADADYRAMTYYHAKENMGLIHDMVNSALADGTIRSYHIQHIGHPAPIVHFDKSP
jgi:hypothetical protein